MGDTNVSSGKVDVGPSAEDTAMGNEGGAPSLRKRIRHVAGKEKAPVSKKSRKSSKPASKKRSRKKGSSALEFKGSEYVTVALGLAIMFLTAVVLYKGLSILKFGFRL